MCLSFAYLFKMFNQLLENKDIIDKNDSWDFDLPTKLVVKITKYMLFIIVC